MQADIPVQPDETPVTAALRVFARLMGWAVMHTTDGAHSKHSYHYTGRAVDLADRAGPGRDTSALLAIDERIVQVLPLSMIRELIYAGPGNVCVQNGKLVNGMSVFGPDIMAEHHDHVHLAVVEDFTYQGGSPVPDDPALPNITGPVEFHPIFNADGIATGYYIFSQKTGELHAFGEGAKYFGRSEVLQ